jgi:hypothetical protein
MQRQNWPRVAASLRHAGRASDSPRSTPVCVMPAFDGRGYCGRHSRPASRVGCAITRIPTAGRNCVTTGTAALRLAFFTAVMARKKRDFGEIIWEHRSTTIVRSGWLSMGCDERTLWRRIELFPFACASVTATGCDVARSAGMALVLRGREIGAKGMNRQDAKDARSESMRRWIIRTL